MTKKQTLGHITNINIDIDGIMKHMNITLNSINLFVGQNGVGKTFILIMIWIVSSIATMSLMGLPHAHLLAVAKLFLDRSYDDMNFTGKVEADFDGMSVIFTLDKGIIINLAINKVKDLEPGNMPIFMSKNTRLFSDITRYLKMKKMLGIVDMVQTPERDVAWEKIAELYKIYDISFMEGVVAKNTGGRDVNPQMQVSLKEQIGKDIVKIHYDPDAVEFYYEDLSGDKHSLTKMSAGEQALINMYTAHG